MQKKLKQYSLFQIIPIYIKDALSEEVNILNVIDEVESRVPQHIAQTVDAIYVGHFKEFSTKKINAMYRDGAIYISNSQDNDSDMIDDIIHEFAHAAEDIYAAEIYSDGVIQREFAGKRKRLESILQEYGYLDGV